MTRRIHFLPVALCLALLALGCGDDPAYNRVAEADFDVSFDVTTQTGFDLEGVNGAVTVTGSAATNQITVAGTRRVRSDSQADAENRLLDLQVATTVSQDAILVRTEQPQNTEGRSYEVDYVITLPVDLAIHLVTVNGNVTVSNAKAGLDVSGVNGNITVSNVDGLDVTIVNGNVTVTDAEDINVAVTNGNITFDINPPPGDEVHAATVNGNIVLVISAGASTDIKAIRENGTVTTISLPLTNYSDDGRVFKARLGAGEGQITLQTVNGNIVLSAR